MNDKISNTITKIKNASLAKKEFVTIPYSSTFINILSILQDKKFIDSFTKKGKKIIKNIEIKLSYDENGKTKINGLRRNSSSTKRVYKKTGEIRPIKNNYGYLIISTSKGIMTGEEAKKEKIGGEPLFEIW